MLRRISISRVALVVLLRLPGRLLLAAFGELLATLVGQLERAAALTLGIDRVDQALVLELCQRGVDRAGAWAPATVAALLETLHQLVAVHRAVE